MTDEAEKWSVGRSSDNFACYVREGEPWGGEIGFPTEIAAVEYAISSDEEVERTVHAGLKVFRARHRQIKKAMHGDPAARPFKNRFGDHRHQFLQADGYWAQCAGPGLCRECKPKKGKKK